MSEKRRVIAGSSRTSIINNDTPTRVGGSGVRASPSVAGLSGAIKARVINNNSTPPTAAGKTSTSSSTVTPTAASYRAGAGVAKYATPSSSSTLSPSVSASRSGQVRARVLGYSNNASTGSAESPLANGTPITVPPAAATFRSPPVSHPMTPQTTSSSSTASAASSSSARAHGAGSHHLPPHANISGSSVTSSAGDIRKVRAASTPPSQDSPTVNVVRPSARAFPSFSSGQGQHNDASTSNNTLSHPGKARVRGISSRNINEDPAKQAGGGNTTTTSPSLATSRPTFSKSMSSRPASANPSTLLPSPTIRASTSSGIFPSVSSSSARPTASPKLTSSSTFSSRPASPVRNTSDYPSQSSSSSQTRPGLQQRATSPVRASNRPASSLSYSTRPGLNQRSTSPARPTTARPTSILLPTSPQRSNTSHFSPSSLSTSVPSSPVTIKRPSTSSQSSNSNSLTSSITASTSATTAFSPDPSISPTTQHATVPSASTASSGVTITRPSFPLSSSHYHRSRRRSHSSSSSVSSNSGLNAGGGGGNSRLSAQTRLHDAAIREQSAERPALHATNMGIGISMPPLSSSPITMTATSPPNPLFVSSKSPTSPSKAMLSHDEVIERQDAKVNRKILDLEITNTSLLAINASLEKAKIKQAAELRDLRRKMRERSFTGSALLSPSSEEYAWGSDDLIGIGATAAEDEQEMTWEEMLREDERFSEIVTKVEGMNRRAKEALEKTVTNEGKLIGGKVLNQYLHDFDAKSTKNKHLAPAVNCNAKRRSGGEVGSDQGDADAEGEEQDESSLALSAVGQSSTLDTSSSTLSTEATNSTDTERSYNISSSSSANASFETGKNNGLLTNHEFSID